MPNNLNPDQDRHSVSPDLVPNYLHNLSADDKRSPLTKKELNKNNIIAKLPFVLFKLARKK